eukprot:CAMPEP_0119464952 /NCGR_PEP_ID=MMETSP1344-20130328/313_1 /TAXON_ID=236787 /ORGANISM="Florenciella parvula, Strain CCMP2471" /LENGTH=131 /DNA_ID=CAMNT_0007497191 /DNA_START=534 /DNA_END=925 /DNA_ORIENTATION=-
MAGAVKDRAADLRLKIRVLLHQVHDEVARAAERVQVDLVVVLALFVDLVVIGVHGPRRGDRGQGERLHVCRLVGVQLAVLAQLPHTQPDPAGQEVELIRSRHAANKDEPAGWATMVAGDDGDEASACMWLP